MTEIIETESSQDELASDDDLLLYKSPKRKLNSTVESTGVSSQLISTEFPNTVALQIQKVN